MPDAACFNFQFQKKKNKQCHPTREKGNVKNVRDGLKVRNQDAVPRWILSVCVRIAVDPFLSLSIYLYFMFYFSF